MLMCHTLSDSHHSFIYRLLSGVTTSQTRNLRSAPLAKKRDAPACSPVRPVRRPIPDSSGVVSLTPDACLQSVSPVLTDCICLLPLW